MSLKDRITDDMKSAMRAGERERLSAIRLILAAIKQREVDERITLDDSQVIAVLERLVKQRRESIAQFASGGRADLVAKESAELALVTSYLPAQLSEPEVAALIDEAIRSSGAASLKDMGKVMGAVKAKAQGRTDMSSLSARIKERLSAAPKS
ncbi:MAG: GatB/YqeY domain-containing protein [Steroidobacteraceae bacterium]